MALLLRGITTGNIAPQATSRAVMLPAVQAGDYMLLQWWINTASAVVTPPDGWEIIEAGVHPDSNHRSVVFGKIAGGAEPNPQTFHFATSTTSAYGCIAWRSSLGRLIYVDDSAIDFNPDDTEEHLHPSVTVTASRAQLHCFLSLVSPVIEIVTNSPMTERWSVGVSGLEALHGMTQRLTEPGPTGARTATSSAGVGSIAITVALAEEGGPVETGHTAVWVDEFLLSSETAGVELATVGANYDVTHIAAAATMWERRNLGSTLRQRGYFVGALAGHLALEAQDRMSQAEAAYVAALFDIQRLDAAAYVLPSAGASQFTITAPAKSVITVDAEWVAGVGLKRGKRVYYDDVDEGAEGEPVDLGGVGTAGYAYLFVKDEHEDSEATVIIETDMSDTFSIPTTAGTFNVSEVGAIEIQLSGTIGPWVRLRCTSATGGFTIMCVVAVEGVTY